MTNIKENNPEENLDIAIIGMSGRFPKVHNLDFFWQNLRNGVESISLFSEQELESVGVDRTLLSDPNYVKAGAILEDVELFDASFFDYSPRTAEIMDPQHRFFLESAWEAFENAGYDSETYEGLISVYGSVSFNSYFLFNLFANPDLMKLVGIDQIRHNNRTDNLATRVAYKLNLKGSAITVQTGCSSSLVAVHLACQSLLDRECDLALAGGVSISASQKTGYLYQEGGILSPDGHCRAFDANARGTVIGNGVGTVVLKRLTDAIADRDSIHAVIKGSAINNDGALKVGYTAPSIEGQSKVIAEALAIAGINPETVGYVEAHGTGTILGDPIEVAALTKSFRAKTQKKNFCAIGSVKTNIGHLDTAAGVAGLIKTILAFKHQQIPPSLHFEQPNPQIDFENSPFYVNTELSEWKTNGTPRRAGVSAFGIGGTNAHLILEEAPVAEASSPSRTKQLLLLSAKTPSALETATTNLTARLKQHPELNLADVAYTLQVGRRGFNHRRMVIAEDIEDALNALESDSPRVLTSFTEERDRAVVFMFTGQGAQYANMAQELYQSEVRFREECDRCCELLKPHLGLDLRQLLYPKEGTETVAQQLQQTAITQPALFVIEYALAKLWMSWGIQPSAAIGHSIGEYVAATIAGVFSLEDALALVAARGKLMQQLPPGSMLAIPLPEAEVQPLLNAGVSVAVINGVSSCVVSGTTEAIEALQKQLASSGVDCRRLHTSHAFHSPMMEPMMEPFQKRVEQVTLEPPKIPYISNVTGTWISDREATDPAYWTTHIRQTVRFAKGLEELLKKPAQVLLEVSPGRTLSQLAQQHPQKQPEQVVFTSISHPKEKQSDVAFLLKTLGQLWLAGVRVDWSGFYAYEKRDRIPLPTYPFERQRYWIEPAQPRQDKRLTSVSLGKKTDLADWFYIPCWKQSVPPVSIKPEELVAKKSCTLVFIDECDLGSNLTKRLGKEGHDVITVQVGTEFAQLNKSLYTLNPEHSHDYETLFEELLAQKKLPETIVHLWSVTPVTQTESELTGVEKAQNTGFYSLLFLARTLGKLNLTEMFQIAVVSNNMQSVTGEELLFPEKATLLGPVKVIPQEYPNINCRSIDVVLPPSGSWQQQKLVEQLLSELKIPKPERAIAYRGNHRWLQTFEPVRLDESLEKKPQLREEGVYLITGGLGEIGLVLAKYLAQTVRAKLILIGRSAFPGRQEWNNWLTTHDETNHVSRKIRKVQELEKLGAEVLIVSADVANLAQMTEAIEKAQLHFGQLNGVIHAAGIVGKKSRNSIAQLDKAKCEQQFKSKVYGTLVLEKVLHNQELDFCLLMSSLSSILGGLARTAYAAANLFMDRFVSCHNQNNPVEWLSVNWDGWQINEDQTEAAYFGLSSAQLQIEPEKGVKALQRILCYGKFDRVVVSTGNLSSRLDQWIQPKTLADRVTSQKTSLHPRPDLQSSYVAPKNETEQKLADIWQQLLGLEQIGIHDNFFELGGDSLLAIQVISRVRKTLHTELSVNRMFETPTVADLSKHLENLGSTNLKQPSLTTVALGQREEGVL